MVSPQEVDALCEKALECLRKRDAKGAIALYEQAIAADVRHIAAHEGLAMVCFRIKDYDRAIELLTRVTRLAPQKADPLINLGAIYNKQGEFKKAIDTLRKALSKDRRCPEAYYNLGIAQKGLNQFSMAVSAYKEAIRLRPDMAEAYANLGNVFIEMKNLSQAKLNFNRALEINPDFAKARQGLLRTQDRADEAKRAINPFGRLVDMAEVERKNKEGEKKFRELSPQERFDDRTEVHHLTKLTEQHAAAFLNQIRDEIKHSLLAMSRIANGDVEAHYWARETENLETAIMRFDQFSQALFQSTDELKAHEKFIRGE